MPINQDTVWTDEMIKRLRQLHASGMNSFEAIAAALRAEFKVHLTKNACIGKGRRLGLQKRRPSYQVLGYVKKTRKRTPSKPAAPRREAPQEQIPAVLPRWPVALPRCPAKHVTIYQLEPSMCRYPFGDDGPPYVYCGRKAVRGSWCAEHLDVVSQ
jgi:hypothetical protein